MPYTYEYPRPAFTVDILVYRKRLNLSPLILLIKRGKHPFAGMWALPGGFVDMDEELDEAATRELEEETGLHLTDLQQFRTYGTIGRDPRARTISTIFVGESKESLVRGGDDAAEAAWFELHKLPLLAFDHAKIIDDWKFTLTIRPL